MKTVKPEDHAKDLKRLQARLGPTMRAAIKALRPICQGLDYYERKALIVFLVMQTKGVK